MSVRQIAQGYGGAAVAVTGATGFVGRHLALRLLNEGAQVTVLARDASRLDPVLARACTVVRGDLLDAAALQQLVRGVAWVFHCAANVATWGRWQDYQRANVQGVRGLIEAMRAGPDKPGRLVHLSTLDVYGFPELPADEGLALRPVAFHYGESKRQGDALVHTLCGERGVPYTVLRPGNIVGPGSPFVERIGAALRSGLMLSVDGGHHHAGLLDVCNLLDVMLWAGQASIARGQTYNVRDPWDACWAEYLHDFRQGSGLGGRVLNLDYRVAMALASLVGTPWRWLGLRTEPLLHPLIVQVFGRTCGHSIAKLQSHGAPLGRVDYAGSLRTSLDWLAAQAGNTQN